MEIAVNNETSVDVSPREIGSHCYSVRVPTVPTRFAPVRETSRRDFRSEDSADRRTNTLAKAKVRENVFARS